MNRLIVAGSTRPSSRCQIPAIPHTARPFLSDDGNDETTPALLHDDDVLPAVQFRRRRGLRAAPVERARAPRAPRRRDPLRRRLPSGCFAPARAVPRSPGDHRARAADLSRPPLLARHPSDRCASAVREADPANPEHRLRRDPLPQHLTGRRPRGAGSRERDQALHDARLLARLPDARAVPEQQGALLGGAGVFRVHARAPTATAALAADEQAARRAPPRRRVHRAEPHIAAEARADGARGQDRAHPELRPRRRRACSSPQRTAAGQPLLPLRRPSGAAQGAAHVDPHLPALRPGRALDCRHRGRGVGAAGACGRQPSNPPARASLRSTSSTPSIATPSQWSIHL